MSTENQYMMIHAGNRRYSEFEITSEYIHTSCLGYDLYDSSDYTHFIVITKE